MKRNMEPIKVTQQILDDQQFGGHKRGDKYIITDLRQVCDYTMHVEMTLVPWFSLNDEGFKILHSAEEIKLKEEAFYLVWNPKTAHAKYRHSTYTGAKNEAERLAQLHKGDEFIVMRAVSKSLAKSVITEEYEPEIPF